MILDARAVEQDSVIVRDVCVVGAGAAGITLALELGGSPLSVALLESGGVEPDPATQALYRGEVVGRPYYPLDVCRLRYFGGTTNHWGGMCRPMEDIDFVERAWIPDSGWPFPRSELAPFYQRAEAVCQVGRFEWDPAFWERALDSPALPLDPRRVKTRVARFRPLRFGETYRSEIERSGSVTALLHANALEIELDATGNAAATIRVGTLSGRRFRVQARVFVLAAGGIENPRLLLLSSRARLGGLGNQHGLVGRYFMEHLWCTSGELQLLDPYTPSRLYQRTRFGDMEIMGTLTLAEEVMEREGLAHFNCELDVDPGYEFAAGVRSAKVVAGELRNRRFPDGFATHVRNVVRDLDVIADYGLRRALGRGLYGPEDPVERPIVLNNFSEQVPNPASRVTLSEEKDAFGQNRARLDWRFTELDRFTVRRAHEILGSELGARGVGRLRTEFAREPSDWPAPVVGGAHHQGTTRMHDDEHRGVVDRNGRVHDVANLYVAGCSVFPTGGFANPTFTIVALAIRLADHLRERLA